MASSVSQSRSKVAIDNAPTPFAQEQISQYYKDLEAKQLQEAIPIAARMNAERAATVTKEAIQINYGQTQRDPSSFEDNLEIGAKIIATSDIPESRKEDAIREYRNELTWYRFKGLIAENPNQALKELDSGDWDVALTPEQTDKLKTAADQQIKSVRASAAKKLSGEISDYLAYKMSGGAENRRYSGRS